MLLTLAKFNYSSKLTLASQWLNKKDLFLVHNTFFFQHRLAEILLCAAIHPSGYQTIPWPYPLAHMFFTITVEEEGKIRELGLSFVYLQSDAKQVTSIHTSLAKTNCVIQTPPNSKEIGKTAFCLSRGKEQTCIL